jgi:8-oxo-dGTP pyrophosphatase MutT (NUDIX family)
MKLLMERWNNYLQEEEDMLRVSKAVIADNDERILILKRASNLITEETPWEWDLPGGHVQEGEKDSDALAREVEEETSLMPDYVPDWFMLSGSTRFFFLDEWGGTVSLSEEHSEYEWIDPAEAGNYDLGRMYQEAIRTVRCLKFGAPC